MKRKWNLNQKNIKCMKLERKFKNYNSSCYSEFDAFEDPQSDGHVDTWNLEWQEVYHLKV